MQDYSTIAVTLAVLVIAYKLEYQGPPNKFMVVAVSIGIALGVWLQTVYGGRCLTAPP